MGELALLFVIGMFIFCVLVGITILKTWIKSMRE